MGGAQVYFVYFVLGFIWCCARWKKYVGWTNGKFIKKYTEDTSITHQSFKCFWLLNWIESYMLWSTYLPWLPYYLQKYSTAVFLSMARQKTLVSCSVFILYMYILCDPPSLLQSHPVLEVTVWQFQAEVDLLSSQGGLMLDLTIVGNHSCCWHCLGKYW